MGFTEALRLVVDADTRGAVQGIEKLGTAAEREFSKSEKSLDRWGSRLTSVGTGMIAFGGAALVGLGAMARESEEANLAVVKLENTIANMPKLAGATSKEFIDLADSIQSMTAADADAIVEAEALLGTFNLTAQEIKGVTPLVVDYARKFGIDIPDAAIQVGKALDGQVGALKRNGVSIDEVLFKTDRYRAVSEALSDQVGGFAEAEGKTFAGSLERMKNELGDLAEGVGGGAVDAFTTMFGAVEKVAGGLESISPGAQSAIGKFATFGAVGLVAAGALSTVIGQAIQARKNFGELASGLSSATEKLGGLRAAAGLAAGAAGLAGLAVALKMAVDAAEAARLEDYVAALTSTTEASRKASEQGILASAAIGALDESFANVLDSSVPAAEQFIAVAESLGISKKEIDALKVALEEKKAADIGGAAAQSEYTGEVDAGADALSGQAEATRDATTAMQDYATAIQSQFDPLFGAISASRALTEANNDVTAAEMEVAAAVRDHGADSLEAMAATDKLTDAQLNAAESALSQEVALSELVDMVHQSPQALESAIAKMQVWVDQGRISQETADTTAAAMRGYATDVGSIPTGHNTDLTTTGAPRAISEADILADHIGRIPRDVNIVTRLTNLVPGSLNIPLRAAGGPVVAGQPYIVGEKRPELFIPDRDGMIYPTVPMSSPAGSWGGGGGGSVTQVTEHINLILDGRVVAETVRRYDRNNAMN